MLHRIFLLILVFLNFVACESSDSPKTPVDQPQEKPSKKEASETSKLYSGEFIYGADAASFKNCQTGEQYPVTGKEEFIQLQEAYLHAEHDAFQPEWVQVKGYLEEQTGMSGEKELHLIIQQFIGLEENRLCE